MSDLVERLRKAALLLPIRRNDTADYAEIIGPGFCAMTVTPERFEALSVLPEVADRIEALEAENARLREDAARYRYLRNRAPGPEGKPPPHGLFIGMVPENLILTEEHADVAIDAARKALGDDDE